MVLTTKTSVCVRDLAKSLQGAASTSYYQLAGPMITLLGRYRRLPDLGHGPNPPLHMLQKNFCDAASMSPEENRLGRGMVGGKADFTPPSNIIPPPYSVCNRPIRLRRQKNRLFPSKLHETCQEMALNLLSFRSVRKWTEILVRWSPAKKFLFG